MLRKPSHSPFVVEYWLSAIRDFIQVYFPSYDWVTVGVLLWQIGKRVYPHLLRHSIATILLDSGLVPIDQVQKFLGHLNLSTTQIYAETSLRALGDNYVRAMGGKQ